MSRSGYSDDYGGTEWDLIRWRGAVASALRGKRGQAFLREALAALDALPEKKLIAHDLIAFEHDPLVEYIFAPFVEDLDSPWVNRWYEDVWCRLFGRREGGVCLLGSVGVSRGAADKMATVDPEDRESVAGLFDIPHALACEVMFENDEGGRYAETPRARWERMRRWIVSNLKGDQPADATRSVVTETGGELGPGNASHPPEKDRE